MMILHQTLSLASCCRRRLALALIAHHHPKSTDLRSQFLSLAKRQRQQLLVQPLVHLSRRRRRSAIPYYPVEVLITAATPAVAGDDAGAISELELLLRFHCHLLLVAQ